MEPKLLEKGDIMQITPEHGGIFPGCLFVVTEVKSWGASGYVPSNPPTVGVFPYRVKWEDMEPTGGKVLWFVD
jgi:hypothetical protein